MQRPVGHDQRAYNTCERKDSISVRWSRTYFLLTF